MVSKKELLDRIEKLEAQINEDIKYTWFFNIPTLNGKINAIIKYLDINIEVKAPKEPKPATIVVKKIETKKGTK